MAKIAYVEGSGMWAVLFSSDNQPVFWGEIIGRSDDIVILENYGQCLREIILEFNSPDKAQEAFMQMSENAGQ